MQVLGILEWAALESSQAANRLLKLIMQQQRKRMKAKARCVQGAIVCAQKLQLSRNAYVNEARTGRMRWTVSFDYYIGRQAVCLNAPTKEKGREEGRFGSV